MKYKTGILIHIFILLSSFSFVARTEFFTSISELEILLHTEGELVKTLDKYVEAEEKRLEQVKRLSREYEKMYNSGIDNAERFLSNPVNAYLLVKRLTTDWRAAGTLIDESKSKAVFENLTHKELKFPDDEDLTGAAHALFRLQETYLLNTTNIASGEITGATKSIEFTAGDCYELGYQAFLEKDYPHCTLWMKEALKRLEEENVPSAKIVPVLEHLAYASYMIGNDEDAIKATKDIILNDSSYLPAHENLVFYQQHMEDVAAGRKSGIANTTENQSFRNTWKRLIPEFGEYERLCRGEKIQTPQKESKLHCRYTSNNSSYLLLMPVKEEELSLDPRIVMFHDVISDKEIAAIKNLALPRLLRATVANPETGDIETAYYRVSKSAWLFDNEHPLVEKTSWKIQEVTGLATNTAEELHVINYGIGGHYEPHYDFTREGEVDGFAELGTGNRIATWIYYLSDVESGGATVFPGIGVQVKPIKGSAAFWYNLRRSGDGDLNTKHAACPVLAGSKWIANKWIHEVNQEFRRKCSLNRFE